MENEIWRKCPILPDNYEVSNLGNVRYWKDGISHSKYLRVSKDGYAEVKFSVNAKNKYARVSRCVALSFIPNPNNLPEVNHINYNKLDNSVTNLEWISGIDNIKHGLKQRQRQVYQYTTKGVLIAKYESQDEAHKKLGYGNVANIHQCVKGTIKSAYGYIWSETPLDKSYFDNFDGKPNRGAVKIAQYTIDGHFIRAYDKIKDTRKYGFNPASISECINGNRGKHKNFKWVRYVDAE